MVLGGEQNMVQRRRFLALWDIECLVHGLALGLRINSERLNVFVAGVPRLRAPSGINPATALRRWSPTLLVSCSQWIADRRSLYLNLMHASSMILVSVILRGSYVSQLQEILSYSQGFIFV
jgi:hypothetical protein